MGNQITIAAKNQKEYLSEIPFVVLKDSLGGGRFLKTFLCVHDKGGQVVVKQWIAYQMIKAVAQIHEQGICHGDIKCENFLVTSWNWIFLSDFAMYKPTYLPEDNPAYFSFFFDTGGRRRCYIAPERFCLDDSNVDEAMANAPLEPSMDIYSLGCCLAELFLDGHALFELSDLIAYKNGKHDQTAPLCKVDEPFRLLILHMINVDPGARWSAAEYLDQWGSSLFPPCMQSLLYPFFGQIMGLGPDERLCEIRKGFKQLFEEVAGHHYDGRYSKDDLNLEDNDDEVVTKKSHFMKTTKNVDEPYEKSTSKKTSKYKINFGDQSTSILSSTIEETLVSIDEISEDVMRLLDSIKETSNVMKGIDGVAASTDLDKPKLPQTLNRTVVLEETYEYQCRDRGRAFGKASTSGHDKAHMQFQPPFFLLKEQIALPTKGNWVWTEDWKIVSDHNSDDRGWSYLLINSSKEEGKTLEDTPPVLKWTSRCVLDCLWRRRKWTRQRRNCMGELLELSELAGHSKSAYAPANPQCLIIIVSLISSSMLGLCDMDNLADAILLLAELATVTNDDTKLQIIIPYIMECVTVPSTSIKVIAMNSLVKILDMIKVLPSSDERIVLDYILPCLESLKDSDDKNVKVALMSILGPLARTTKNLMLNTANKLEGGQGKLNKELEQIKRRLLKLVVELATNANLCESISVALLKNMESLAIFLEQRDMNDVLLPLVTTLLNSRSWRVRHSFLVAATCLVQTAGLSGFEAYLLPCLTQALNDEHNNVIAEAINLLCNVARGSLRRESLIAFITGRKGVEIFPRLLLHSSFTVKNNTATFVAIAASRLSDVDVHVFLIPAVSRAFSKNSNTENLFRLSRNDLNSAERLLDTLAFQEDRYQLSSPTSSHQTESNSMTEHSKTIVDRKANPFLGDLVDISEAPLYSITFDESMCGVHESALESVIKQNVPAVVCETAEKVKHILTKSNQASDGLIMLDNLTNNMQSDSLNEEEAISFQVDTWRQSLAPVRFSQPRPLGVLATTLMEHSKAVTKLTKHHLDRFFVSSSYDGSVKLWTNHHPYDMSFQSRATYNGLDGRITGCVMCDSEESIAASSSNGAIHLWKVEYMSNSINFQNPKGVYKMSTNEGRILDVQCWNNLLLYSTIRGNIHASDLRTKNLSWTVQGKVEQGFSECFLLDHVTKNWLLTGTSRGLVNLWDIRYMVCHVKFIIPVIKLYYKQRPVNTWTACQDYGIKKMTIMQATPETLGINVLTPTSPLVFMTGLSGETKLWELANAKCHMVLYHDPDPSVKPTITTSRSNFKKCRTSSESMTENDFRLRDLHNDAMEVQKGVTALLHTGGETLLTGSSDGCIRSWSCSHYTNSYMVCGPPRSIDIYPKFASNIRTGITYTARELSGVKYIQESSLMTQDSVTDQDCTMIGKHLELREAASHKDTITDLLSINGQEQDSSSALVSASADGIIKIWK